MLLRVMSDVSILDYAFLAFESESSPKHVAGLQIFDLPDGAPDDFVARLAPAIKNVELQAPLNQKLESSMLGMPQWVEDTEIDLDCHIHFEAATAPRTLQQLLREVEDLHAEGLDRSAPLWQLHIFDHLDGRRFAIYFKVHHAYMDGISLSRRTLSSLSEDPNDGELGKFWGIECDDRQQARESLLGQLLGTARSAGKAALVLPGLAKLGLKHGLKLLHLGGDSLPVPFTAPRTAFNTPLTPDRSVAVLDLPLARVRRVAQHAAVTVNDVLLELCDQAMTRYLDDQGGAPDEPLVAQMPVSLRRPDASQGNQITIAILELGSKETNPVRRLQDIHVHTAGVKHELAEMTPETAETYTVLMQGIAQFGESLGIGGVIPPLGNVVISNVIGPKRRLYLCGAPLVAVYPISTIAPSLAMNVTMYTYIDTIHIGIVAGYSAIPDLEPIASNLQLALDDLETAMGIASKRRKTRAGSRPSARQQV